MTDYEAEHNLPPQGTDRAKHARRRPSLTSFFSVLQEVEVPADEQHNAHAEPLPENVVASFRLLANAFETMRVENAGNTELLDVMIGLLESQANDPPTQVKGVPDSFLDELDRVPKKELKKDQTCPICNLPFLDDPYPLVVRLPCHPDHKFDLDCIRPWLKLNPTCPLDRRDVMERKVPVPKPVEHEEEEYDEYFA